jgi:general L-amino acid transport system substrate-binding protein
MRVSTALLACAGLFSIGVVPAAAGTLDIVKERGALICGTHGSRAGFSLVDSQGNYTGLDIDTCKAVAAAVLGDANKTRFVKTTAQTRFPVLQTGEVDVLANTVTITLTRDTGMGFNFGPTTFYDAQGFMVPKASGAKNIKDLDGATICVSPGTTSEKIVADVFRKYSMKYTAIVIDKTQELSQAFFSGRCDATIQTKSGLVAQRAVFAPNPDDFIILNESYGKDPMAPAVRHGDDQWKDVVTWVVYAMIEAEEKGISSQNVDGFVKSEDPEIKRLLGEIPGSGKALGLDEKWAYNVVKQVGNYGEVYDRNFGAKSKLKLERGINELHTRGGLMYAPPFN